MLRKFVYTFWGNCCHYVLFSASSESQIIQLSGELFKSMCICACHIWNATISVSRSLAMRTLKFANLFGSSAVFRPKLQGSVCRSHYTNAAGGRPSRTCSQQQEHFGEIQARGSAPGSSAVNPPQRLLLYSHTGLTSSSENGCLIHFFSLQWTFATWPASFSSPRSTLFFPAADQTRPPGSHNAYDRPREEK